MRGWQKPKASCLPTDDKDIAITPSQPSTAIVTSPVTGGRSVHAGSLDARTVIERYGEIGVPTRILFGRQDAILDPAYHGHRTAAAIPGAKIDTIEGGHMIPITAPEACARFVRAAFAAG